MIPNRATSPVLSMDSRLNSVGTGRDRAGNQPSSRIGLLTAVILINTRDMAAYVRLADTTKGLVVAQIAALWVAVFTLGLTHEMGVNYVLLGGTAPSNPLIHATNDTAVSLIPYLATIGIGELIARQTGDGSGGVQQSTT